MPTALYLSPHPDDEALGAPGAVLALIEGGWRVINLACSLGRPSQHARRRRELMASCERLGLELEVLEPPVAMSVGAGDDLGLACRALVDGIIGSLERLRPVLLIGPDPCDAHPGHALVARAAADALAPRAEPTRWWRWSLWSDHPSPNLMAPIHPRHLQAAGYALDAHSGELARTDYRTLLRARAEVAGAVGIERVFGFGSVGRDQLPGACPPGAKPPAMAELLLDLERVDHAWRRRPPRVLDVRDPLGVARSLPAGAEP